MFDVIKETNMVYCAGCSFTWGQNLWFQNPLIYNRFKGSEEIVSDKELTKEKQYYKENYDKDKENQLWPYKAPHKRIFDFNSAEDLFQWTDQQHFINDVDYITMYELRYSNRLQKNLPENWGVVNMMTGNGGDNTSIINDYLPNLHYARERLKDKVIFVLQLTHALRDYRDSRWPVPWSSEKGHLIATHLKVNELYKELKKQKIDLIVWSYPADLGWLMRKEPYFCNIKINNEFYHSFEEAQLYSSCDDTNFLYDNKFKRETGSAIREKSSFKPKHDVPITLRQSLGFGDDHPSKEFHQVMADSIYYKMNELNFIGENK